MNRVSVEQDAAHAAGHAVIRVHGAADALAEPRFRLRRIDYEQGVLGPGGWQVGDTLLLPDGAETEGADLLLRVGPAVANHLEEAVYVFSLPRAGVEQSVAWPAIAPLHGGIRLHMPRPAEPAGGAGDSEAWSSGIALHVVSRPDALQTSRTAADPPEGGTVVVEADRSENGRPGQRRRTVLRRSGLGAFALLLIGLLVFLAYPAATPPPQPTPRPPPGAVPAPVAVHGQDAPPPAAASPPASPDLSGLSPADVVARAGSPRAIFTEGERRLHAGLADDGVALVEEAARQGDADALAALAGMFDPGTPPAAGLNKNPLAAARDYQAAAHAGNAAVAARRAALQTELQARAAIGDPLARQALQYWP